MIWMAGLLVLLQRKLLYDSTMLKSSLDSKKLPDAPGVYYFIDGQQQILYIGKATSLRNRVRSYFASDIKEKRSELIEKMVADAHSIECTETDSVLEALILETNLIRTHKPRYNTRSKDDKSYNHLVITKEEFPRVLIVRGKDLTERFAKDEIKYEFGPFPNGQLFREALKIVRKIFRFYDTTKPIGTENTKLERGRINFNRQIGLYPNSHNKVTYTKTIRHIRLFFQGKKKQILKELHRDMMQFAKEERFEEAAHIKKKIFALMHIQDVALIKSDAQSNVDELRVRIEAYDVAHLQGSDMVGVMTVVEYGQAKPSEYRKFKIQSINRSNDTAALSEILIRRFGQDTWSTPRIVVTDGGVAQKSVAEEILKKTGINAIVLSVVKDDKHKPIKILGDESYIHRYKQEVLLANAEAHRFALTYHRFKRSKRMAKVSS